MNKYTRKDIQDLKQEYKSLDVQGDIRGDLIDGVIDEIEALPESAFSTGRHVLVFNYHII